MIPGYNIRFKLNNKTFVGVTNDSLSISAIIKESITKDNAGVKQVEVTGHDITFKVDALFCIESSSHTTSVDRDDVLALALAVGSAAVIPFEYSGGSSSADSYTGNAIITGYSESTPADPESDSTVSVDLRATSFTKATS